MSSPRPLLASLAHLALHERIVKVIGAVRALAPAKQQAFVAELDAGSSYEQYFAALAALAVRDQAWVQAHLADPAKHIQRLALRGVAIVPDQAIASAIQGDVSRLARKALLRRGLAHRPALAERLLPSIRATWGDQEAVSLLAHCSSSTAAQVLPELLTAVRLSSNWRRLASVHPAVLFDALAQDLDQLSKKGVLPPTWWENYGEGTATLVNQSRSPQLASKVLDLVESTLNGAFPLTLEDALPALARAQPLRIVKFFASGQLSVSRLSRTAGRRVLRAALGTPELVQYARRSAHDIHNILSAIPPKARTGLFQAVNPPPYKRLPSARALDLLPAATRTSVAKQVLQEADLPAYARREALSFLPPSEAEAQQTLKSCLRTPDASERGEAYVSYVRQARRSGDASVWAAVLADVAQRIKNEQAPVRDQVISAIADEDAFHPQLVSKDTLAPLKQIAIDADQAPDSHGLTSAFFQLVVRTVAHLGSDKAVIVWGQELVKLIEPYDVSGVVIGDFPRGKEGLLWLLLGGQAEALAKQGHYTFAIDLALLLGARAENVPELQEVLLQGVQESSDALDGERLIQLFLKPKATRADRLAKLLKEDASVANIGSVASYIVRTQPEAVAKLLTSPPVGRFLDQGVAEAWVLPASSRALRTLPPETLKLYVNHLVKAVRSARSGWNRGDLIGKLAQLPGAQELFESRVSKGVEGSEDVRTFEQELKGLAAPQYLPLLLSHASDQHARVALPAASKAADAAPPSVVKTQFTSVLNGAEAKVTSRKAAVHVLARNLPVSEVADILAAQVGKPNLHRDVLAAIVSVTRSSLLGSEEGWKILDHAIAPLPEERQGSKLDAQASARVEDRNVVRAHMAEAAPFSVPSRYWKRYAGVVVALAKSKDEFVAVEASKALVHWALFDEGAAYPVLEDGVVNLSRRSVRIWTAAAGSIAALSHTPAGEKTLTSSVSRLLGASDAELNAARDWDLPNLRLVEVFGHEFQFLLKQEGVYTRAAWAFAKTLVHDKQAPARVTFELLARLVDVPQLVGKPAIPSRVPELAELVNEGIPDAAALLAALGQALIPLPGLVSKVTTILQQRLCSPSVEDSDRVVALLDWLQGQSSTHALLALTLTEQLGNRQKWSASWRLLVRKLRAHKAPDVRALALDINTGETPIL